MKKGLLSILVLILGVSLLLTGCTPKAPEPPKVDAPAAPTSIDKWPHSNLTIVVPYNPGGTNDRQARALAPFIQHILGVPVLVENRAGGGTTVAYNTHKASGSDNGSEIIFGNMIAYCTAIIRGAYEWEDFVSLGTMSSGHRIIAVNPKFDRFDDFEDFIAKIKANPDKYSQSVGAGWGLVFDQIMAEAGLKTRLVPVDGGATDRLMFLAGDIDFYVTDYESMVAIMEPDDFKVLAILSDTSPYDFPVANDLMKDLGYNVEFPNMISPRSFHVKKEFKDKHPATFDFLVNVLVEAASHPAFAAEMLRQGYVFQPDTPENTDDMFYQFYQNTLKYRAAFE